MRMKRPSKSFFLPVKVRQRLETHVADNDNKRRHMYKLYSQLAVHPNMTSVILMRSEPDQDVELGPFMNPERLRNLLFELGRLGAWDRGKCWIGFCLDTWPSMSTLKADYRGIRQQWSATFSETISI